MALSGLRNGRRHNHLHIPAPKNIFLSLVCNIQSDLLPVPHGVGVDLTHVPAPVTLLDAVEVEVPLVLAGPGERDPGVAGDHVVVDGEDGLGIHSNPSNLRQPSIMCSVSRGFKMFYKMCSTSMYP